MAVSMKSSSFVSPLAATGLLARGHEGHDQRSASFPVRGPLRAGHQRSAAERQQVHQQRCLLCPVLPREDGPRRSWYAIRPVCAFFPPPL
jgi:hypothetical protein